MKTETTTTETDTQNEINQLEDKVQTKLAEFKETPTKEILREINTARSEVEDLKIKLSTERGLRETYWKAYSNTLREDDFLRLWQARLRDEAMLAKIGEIENARLLMRGKPWSGI